MKTIAAIGLVAVTGCASPELQQMRAMGYEQYHTQRFIELCMNRFGYQPHTPEIGQCVERQWLALDAEQARERAVRDAAVLQSINR